MIFTGTKILRHGRAIEAWQRGENPYPVTCEIDVCGACNSRCPSCVGGEHRGVLSLREVAVLLHELANHGTRGVIFTGGGEPTLHQELPEMLSVARGMGLDVGLITNGLRVTPDLLRLAAESCTWIRISLDAGTAEGYAKSHGGTAEEWVAVRRNLGAWAEARDLALPRPTLGVGVLVDDEFLSDMMPAAELADRAGADYCQFRPYYLGSWFGRHTLDPRRYREEYERVAAAFPRVVVQSGDKFKALEQGGCARPYSACHGQQFCGVVCSNGDVTLCCLMRGKPQFVLGNIHEQSFGDIWAGERRQAVLRNLDLKRDCPPLCRCDNLNRILDGLAPAAAPQHEAFL
jgi:cyclic pyranopterin phosphate synthase